MKKDFTYDDIIYRIGYFRNKNNISARDLSLQLGYSESEINRIERKTIKLKVSTLLNILEMFNITPIEFFYPNPEDYEIDMELLDLFSQLKNEDKKSLIQLISKIIKAK